MNPIVRRILGTGSFPRLRGQELPDPVEPGKPVEIVNQARDKALGRVKKIAPAPGPVSRPKE